MSPDNKFDNIYEQMRQRILDGEYGTRGRLPSLRMLADEFSTTHETMNKVMQRLQAEGLVESFDRAGIFVNVQRERLEGITPRFDLHLQERGFTPIERNVVEPGIVSASAEVAKAFGIAQGDEVVHRFRLQGTTDAQYRLAENFYPLELVGPDIIEQMKYDEHFDVLISIRDKHQQIIHDINERVIARLPTPKEYKLLEIVHNSPVCEIQRTSYASRAAGSAIMFSKIVLVGNRFALEYKYSVDFWGKF